MSGEFVVRGFALWPKPNLGRSPTSGRPSFSSPAWSRSPATYSNSFVRLPDSSSSSGERLTSSRSSSRPAPTNLFEEAEMKNGAPLVFQNKDLNDSLPAVVGRVGSAPLGGSNHIRNVNRRAAYIHAIGLLLDWCEAREIPALRAIQPMNGRNRLLACAEVMCVRVKPHSHTSRRFVRISSIVRSRICIDL